MRPAGLAIENLVAGYGRQGVLKDVSLRVGPGEYACLLGRSGSGKSTLLGAVAGFIQPVAGRITIGGCVASEPAARTFVAPQHRGIGMMFQEPTLWPHLTVSENVLFPLRSRGEPADEHQAEVLLDRVGLAGMGRRKPTALSGGQRQRVAMCRALMAKPALVLLDEPLSAVDSLMREELRSYLLTLFSDTGTTALHVTHDPLEAFTLGKHIGVLDRGRLVQWGTPQELYHHPESEVVAGLTGPFRLVEVPAEPVDEGRARFWFDDREWVCEAHPGVSRGRAKLILRPEAVEIAVGEGKWRLLRRRFEGGSFQVEAQHLEGWSIHGRSARELPAGPLSVQLAPHRCWLLPCDEEAAEVAGLEEDPLCSKIS